MKQKNDVFTVERLGHMAFMASEKYMILQSLHKKGHIPESAVDKDAKILINSGVYLSSEFKFLHEFDFICHDSHVPKDKIIILYGDATKLQYAKSQAKKRLGTKQ